MAASNIKCRAILHERVGSAQRGSAGTSSCTKQGANLKFHSKKMSSYTCPVSDLNEFGTFANSVVFFFKKKVSGIFSATLKFSEL